MKCLLSVQAQKSTYWFFVWFSCSHCSHSHRYLLGMVRIREIHKLDFDHSQLHVTIKALFVHICAYVILFSERIQDIYPNSKSILITLISRH